MTKSRADHPSAVAPSLDELIAVFERAQRLLVFTHTDPDLDGVGSQLALAMALRSRGKQVSLWAPRPLPEHYRFLPGTGAIASDYPAGVRFDVAVALDTAALGRVADEVPFAPADFEALVNIDHHPTNERFGTHNWIDPAASSVGEMLYRLFEAWGIAMGGEIAMCLYASIATDTGWFSYSNTTAGALRVAAALLEIGAEPFALWRRIFGSFPTRRYALLARVLATLRCYHHDEIAAVRVTQRMLAEASAQMEDTERFVHYPRTVRGVKVALILRELPEQRGVRVGLRSNGPEIDVSRIAARFGGGGHATAAGCTIAGSLDEVEPRVVEAIQDALG